MAKKNITCSVDEGWHEQEAEEHEEYGDKLPGTPTRQVRFQPAYTQMIAGSTEHNGTY